MYRLVRQALYAIYLVLFTAYAVSPVYLSGPGAFRAATGNSLHAHEDVQVGLLSVKVVLSSLVGDEEEAASKTSARFSHAGQDDELLLILKKRGVIREGSNIRPILQATTLPSATCGLTTVVSREYEIPGDSIHRGPDGYIHHATGLSPPFLLS